MGIRAVMRVILSAFVFAVAGDTVTGFDDREARVLRAAEQVFRPRLQVLAQVNEDIRPIQAEHVRGLRRVGMGLDARGKQLRHDHPVPADRAGPVIKRENRRDDPERLGLRPGRARADPGRQHPGRDCGDGFHQKSKTLKSVIDILLSMENIRNEK